MYFGQNMIIKDKKRKEKKKKREEKRKSDHAEYKPNITNN